MLKKTMIAGLIAAALGSGAVQAQQPAAPAAPTPEYTFTGNFGYFSQYIFRGLTQTNGEPAAQGGFDFNHQSGFYVGTWASNISWLRDFGAYMAGGSLEVDIYGGYKGSIGKTDFGYDAGLLFYWYPGDTIPNGTKADTLEVYGAFSWKWLSAKLSYVISDEAFGVANADGTYYLDLSANFPIPDTKLTLVAHYGIQKYSGNNAAGVSNDSFASYEDYKLGVNFSMPKDYTVGAFYSNTSMDTTQKAFYTTPLGKQIGKDTVTVFLQKTF